MTAMMGCRLILLAAVLGLYKTHFPPDRTGRQQREQSRAAVTHPNTNRYYHNVGKPRPTGRNNGEATLTVMDDVKNCPKICNCSVEHGLVVTDCQVDPIKELPKLLKAYKDVDYLRISSSHLSSLPPEVAQMPKLSSLILDNNQFKQVPEEVLVIERLTSLDLQENKIQKLPSRISKLSKLKSLSLNRNMLGSFPAEVLHLVTLTELDLNFNMIKELPEELATLTNLEGIDLSHNEIDVLPEGVWNITRLERLDLSYNHITTLPDNIQPSIHLSVLDLEGNEIDTWPAVLSKFPYLQNLFLGYNSLKAVGPKFPKRLVILSLHHNQITTVPCHVLDLYKFDLSFNKLKYINCTTYNKNAMSYLNLSHNELQAMPCSLSLWRLSSLDISHNEIQSVPEICPLLMYRNRFPNDPLEWMDLSYNRISVLHSWALCKNKNLKHISFSNNSISAIDLDVFSAPNCLPPFAYVDLSNNMLSTMDIWPLALAKSWTVTVDLSGNAISTFTNFAGRHTSLYHSGSTFQMQRNKIRHFKGVFDGWKIILKSLTDLYTLLGSALFDLGDNPLVCDCVDYEVFRYIQTPGTVRYKATNLVCDKPHGLKGQNPGNISLEKFVCDVTDKCPRGCECTNIPHLQTISIVCKTYNETDIPYVIPVLPKQNYVYHLNLCNLNLSTISPRAYLRKATELLLSNNSIATFHLGSTKAFRKVKVLYLDNNLLQTLPDSITSITNETAEDVRLGNNPWVCDCKTMDMKNWIITNGDMVKDRHSIVCHSPASIAGTRMIDMERSLVCPNENKIAIYIVVGIAIVFVFALANIVVIDRFKHGKWRLVGRDDCKGEGKEFDVFVSYANEDHEYVEGFLIPELEKHDYRVCFHRVHFHGGKPILLNMSEAIEKSKRALVFFSDQFKDSNFCMFEFRLAHHLDVDNNTRRLITIKDTDLDMGSLDVYEVHYFQTYTYIKRENVNFWRCLEHTLPRQKLGAEVY